jgi:hypothetical protein
MLQCLPKSDRYFYPRQSSDGLLCHPSTIHTLGLPSRRHDPGYIPHPRSAFILFRSSYISTAADYGQQNESSKLAGKVWNRMTELEKEPIIAFADFEKKRHQAMYPNYLHCPRGSARRESTQKVGTSELT